MNSHELTMTSNPHYEKTKGRDSGSNSPEETTEHNVLRHPEPEGKSSTRTLVQQDHTTIR